MADPENWIVRIEGRISRELTRQTYELDRAELAITTPMPEAPFRSPFLFPLVEGQSFELKGRIKEASVELMQPTTAEINAALADAYRLRRAVQSAINELSAETWGSVRAKLARYLADPPKPEER